MVGVRSTTDNYTELVDSYSNSTSLQHDVFSGRNEAVNLTVIVAMFVVSSWIILANAVAILCFLERRNESSSSNSNFNTQVLSLSVTDCLVGVSSVFSTLTYSNRELFTTFYPCAFVALGYLMMQIASMYYIFVICLQRFATVFCCLKYKNQEHNLSKRQSLLLVTAVLVFSFAIAVTPLCLFGDPEADQVGCSLNTLFAHGYLKAMYIYNICLLVPQMAINMMYLAMYVRLRSTWTAVGDTALFQMRSTRFPQASDNSQALDNATTRCDVVRNSESLRPCGAQTRTQRSVRSNMTSHAGHRRTFLTIGIILMVMNVCMTPLNLLFVFESASADNLSRKFKFMIVAVSLLNSGMNPIIYAFRIRSFRESCKQLLNRIFLPLQRWCC